jgi:glycosidase
MPAPNYTSVNTEFGSLEDFKKLVKQAHQIGFKVIIDWVANHTGWDHAWTGHILSIMKGSSNRHLRRRRNG